MSKKRKRVQRGGRGERRISVRAIRRDPPDLKKLSQALIALALAQAEKEAQDQGQDQVPAEHDHGDQPDQPDQPDRSGRGGVGSGG